MRPNLYLNMLPRGPVRFGSNSGAKSQTDVVFHSDSLYSAVTSAMRNLGLLEEWLSATATATNPEVRFTSCFPYAPDEPFLPVPRGLWPPPGSSPKLRWKSVRFIPARLAEAVLKGDVISEDRWSVHPTSGCLLPVDRGVVVEPPFRAVMRSHAAVDRMSAAVEHHTTACLEFVPKAGFWCSAAFTDETARDRWNDRVLAAFRLLSDTGIGGRRTHGWGAFDLVSNAGGSFPGSLAAGVPDEASANDLWWLLSVFSPADEDRVSWSRGNYTVLERHGRVESPAGWGTEKLAMRMIEEGAVIACEAEPLGAARNVAPEGFAHPVYRYGVAVAVPVPARAQA